MRKLPRDMTTKHAMRSLIWQTQKSLRISICSSCRRTISTVRLPKGKEDTKKDATEDQTPVSSSTEPSKASAPMTSTSSIDAKPSTSPLASSSSSSTASSAPSKPQPKRKQLMNDTYTKLLEMYQKNAASPTRAAGSSTRNPLPMNDAFDMQKTMSNVDASKLQPGISRYPNNSALEQVSKSVLDRQSSRYSIDWRQLEADYRRRLGRAWNVGDVYAPSDLGPKEQRQWLRRQTRVGLGDVFERIGKSPASFYRNFTVLSEFVTETGRIMHGDKTGLKRKNQRAIARTVRRSVALGLIPSVYKHPMLLRKKVGIKGY